MGELSPKGTPKAGCYMEGILKKDGEKTAVFGVTVFTGWKERYAVIKGNQLLLHEKKPSDERASPALVIDLYKAKVEKLDGNKFSVGGHVLNRTHVFEAPTLKEREAWVNALQYTNVEKGVGIGDFKLLCFIGEGGWGRVYKVANRQTGNVYAMKVIEKQKLQRHADMAAILSEKFFLQEFDHPFIVHLHYTFQTTDKLFLVMDYLSGGDAYYQQGLNGVFPEDVVRLWIAQIVLALDHLHTNNVIYRDLKPENCVLDAEGNMILTDFGLSKKTESGRRKTKVGTPDYMPPEMLQNKEYTSAADYWSLGCLMYEFLVGNHPFQTSEGEVPEYKVLAEEPKLNVRELSGPARELIKKFLVKEPSERLTGLKEIQEMEYFRAIDWEKLARNEIKSTYVPNPNDEENFDKEYTSQKPVLKPSEPGKEFEDFQWEHSTRQEDLQAAAEQDGLQANLT